MKTVCSKDCCTGCMACVDKCPRHAITIKDTLFAYNAVIDNNLCIGCGICFKICQQNSPVKKNTPIKWVQGWSESIEIRCNSTSGGFATAIIKKFIENGGVVCSCVFDSGNFSFKIIGEGEDYSVFTGSKYVKSNTKGIYLKILERLVSGNKVLFVGLPCQVAGLKKYIGERFSKTLFTIDLICHGTPSPNILKIYLKENGIDLSSLEQLIFRKKYIQNKNTISIQRDETIDRYIFSFLQCLNFTASCYECQYAGVNRVSDLTIGDSWGSEFDELEKRMGISLGLCNTEKGVYLIESSHLRLFNVDKNRAIANNNQLRHPSDNDKRDRFIKAIIRGDNYKLAVYQCYPFYFAKQWIKKMLIRFSVIGNDEKTYVLEYKKKTT